MWQMPIHIVGARAATGCGLARGLKRCSFIALELKRFSETSQRLRVRLTRTSLEVLN